MAKKKRAHQAVRLPSVVELREWALDHGYDVGKKGRIPDEIQMAYLDYRYRARKRLKTQGRKPRQA